MAAINVSTLTEELTRNRREFETLFGEKFKKLDAAKQDLTPLPMGESEEVVLLRDFVSNISQPGKTGSTNYTTAISELKQRIGKLKPIKADIKFTETELVNIQKNYIGRREPGDPRDIHSLPGQSYLMGRIAAKMEGETVNAFYKGVHNASNGVQGGVNLFDGFEQLFAEGYAEVIDGGVKDIPDANMVSSAAASIDASNVIAEMRKFEDMIIASPALEEFRMDDAKIFIDWAVLNMLNRAQEDSQGNKDAVATKGTDGIWRLNSLANVELKPVSWMNGTNNLFYSVTGNLFYMYEDDVEADGPSLKFQESDRDLKVLIDANASVNYADGRLIGLYKLPA